LQPTWPTNWLNTWISLESWGKYNNLGKPIRISSTPSPTYQVQGTNAAMSIKVGSRVASCNGLECWLGYAPQLINGLPFIHSLDAQKNFQPLLSGPNYRFKTNHTIAIDPGHGGKDSGARSVFNGEFEKAYTLDWAQRLARLLASNGWNVVLTRTRDVDVSLPDRVAVSDHANADLFLSLHFNSGLPNRELAGIETYCLTPTGMPSSLIRTYEDDPRQSYPNNVFDEQNFQVAVQLHRTLLQSTGATDRGLRRARFMGVLRGQNRPAVLLEAGYLSNAREAKNIASPEYRQKLAEAAAKALD
jgi:N-acetylmuramoyl-L-alanine amidase